MADTSTSYLGIKLKNPLVVSPCPLCRDLGKIKEMEDAGASAIVLHSLFEEQISLESEDLDRYLTISSESYAEALSYFPEMSGYGMGPESYLEHLRKAKQAVKIPIIGSLNGVSTGGWVKYAKLIEDAGADALELNVYLIPTNPEKNGEWAEAIYEELVRDVKANVSIPVAVKIGPYFTAMANVAKRLVDAGADALVLFNRFYQPDFDLEALEVKPDLVLSNSSELRLRLRWAAILYGRVSTDIAITGGVHTEEDVIKAMRAGAKVSMMTSAILKNGIGHLTAVLSNMSTWMEEHDYETVEMMQGSMSQKSVEHPTAFERANYMRVLSSYTVPTSSRRP